MDSAISPVPKEHEANHLFSNSSGEMTSDCNWLIDLASAKENRNLPALEKVTLTECVWNKWNRYDRGCMSSDWNIPELIKRAYGDAGIELVASARAFNTQPPMGCVYPPPVQEVHEFYIIYQREP
jgi:hypothetical protein